MSEWLTVVIGDDVQAVEQLALVLMDSLDLNIEHGVGVDLHLVVLLQVHSKLHLILLHLRNKHIKCNLFIDTSVLKCFYSRISARLIHSTHYVIICSTWYGCRQLSVGYVPGFQLLKRITKLRQRERLCHIC